MTDTMRKSALASTAIGVLLAVPSLASAQDAPATCVQIVGTINSEMQAGAEGTEGRGQADALIITSREAGDGATCIESLDELAAMLGGGDASGLTSIEPAAGAAEDANAPVVEGEEAATAEEEPLIEGEAAGEQAAVEGDEGEGESASATEEDLAAESEATAATEDLAAEDEAAPATDEEMAAEGEAAPATDEQMAAEDQATPATDEQMAAEEAPLGNASEMLAGLTVGELEGVDVLSPEGDDVGTVEFFVVDTEGRVNVVISLDDGVLGMGDSERVVTLDQFDFNTEEGDLVLVQLSEEWLETLPEYDTDTPGYTQIEDDAYAFGG